MIAINLALGLLAAIAAVLLAHAGLLDLSLVAATVSFANGLAAYLAWGRK